MRIKILTIITLVALGHDPAVQAGLLVHEPFNYAPVNDAALGRVAGRDEGIGWGGPWLDSTSGSSAGEAFIYAGSGNRADLYGGTFGAGQPNWDGVVDNLPGRGSYAGLSDWSSEAAGSDRLNSHRPLAQSAGAMAATNGGVLWLSSVWHLPNQGFHATFGIALTSGGSLEERARTLSDSAHGIGVGHGANLTGGGRLNPLFWANGTQSAITLGPQVVTPTLDKIVILKFTFGSTDSVKAWFFNENQPMTEAAFNTNGITVTGSINENILTTLAFSTIRKENAVDEIRIGHTFLEVTAPLVEIRQAVEITAVTRDPQTDGITLTWKSNPGDTYGLQWSTDLVTFYPDVHQSIEAQPFAAETTFGPFSAPGRRFFRIIHPPDTTPPSLRTMGGSQQQVVLTFTEPMIPGTATDPANYLLEKIGGGPAAILSAVIGATPDTVVLTLASVLEEGAGYRVTINRVTDPAGLPILAGTSADFTSRNAPFISEFMASNGTHIQQTHIRPDEDGDSSDWIEIVNPTGAAVDLEGWFLTDNAADLSKWRLPAVRLAPGGHLLVFASGKNRSDPARELHTNFSLAADGEYLALVRADGLSIASEFAPAFPQQTTGISYGLLAGSGNAFRYFDSSTPGLPNPATGFPGVVGASTFNIPRGFYESPLSVRIDNATPDATIRYTLDKSEPTLTNGITATPGVLLPVSTTTCLRTRAFKTGWIPSVAETHTYLFPSAILAQPASPSGFPATWKAQTADYDMDPAVTARYTGQQLRDALKSLPSISIVTEMANLFDDTTGIYDNYSGEGEQWERPASMEWIDPKGGPEIQVNCGLRIQGNAARMFPKKPFRLLFKSIYGPSKLEFPVFPDASDAVQRFDTITLRANSQDQNNGARTQITDEHGRRTLLDMGSPQSHGTHVHLYVNGLYWGLYNSVERPDAAFCSDYLGGSKEEWDVNNGNTAIDGSYAPFDAMLAQVRGGPATHVAYQKIQGKRPDGTTDPLIPAYLDMAGYIDYMLCNFYLGTGDWAGNASQGTRNYYCGRHRTADSPGYQWFVWDLERSLQTSIPTGVTFGPAEPFVWLRTNAEFRLRFADHAQRHLRNSGALTAVVRLPRYTALADSVRAAIILEEARWDLTTTALFESEVANRTASWFPNRATAVIAQFKTDGLFPSLEAPVFSQHGGAVAAANPVTMTTSANTLYYTLDGSDPRLTGGVTAPGALMATLSGGAPRVSAPLFFTGPTLLKARSFDSVSAAWSALNEALFLPISEPAKSTNLVISEIHYHPAAPSTPAELAASADKNDFEFIELHNIGSLPVDLTGVGFSQGITFAFADHTLLPAGGRLVLVRHLAAFTARYGMLSAGMVAGEFAGNLGNDGETLTLAGPSAAALHTLTYNDQLPWPVAADGSGFTLVLLAPATHPDHALPANWTAGSQIGGTPGTGG